MKTDSVQRCAWCGDDPLYVAYHDKEWGKPCHDERMLFELLILEGAQAGLSWITVLRKRENYRKAFDNFDVRKIARYDDKDTARLLADPGIVRNRLKIAATIANAKACLALCEEHGSLDAYLWAYVDGKPLQPRFASMQELPASTPLSDVISKDLKKRGFKFVGSTIIYAYMQATGMTNDHVLHCHQHAPRMGAPK
ncbi:MAG TPA: DNA-3-methyladenine glycosylase I [Rhodocyclaceae bacterium]|jgi:DNA-3-methyladenine glycosylase I|nr:DNA-3-methyladenine glycosylase I [Rhodocyclaceae bacterium]